METLYYFFPRRAKKNDGKRKQEKHIIYTSNIR